MGSTLLIAPDLHFCLFATLLIALAQGYTYELDVSAMNNLYISLESPTLPGWVSVGGDPCGDRWQGVTCIASNITEIRLNGANLGGVLGDKLASFSSILVISLSNNHIAGTIPEGLPVSLQQLYLSDNKFTGAIPSSLSELTSLTALSLNSNLFNGSLPDSFQQLTVLTNVDLSSNYFSGNLPPSMASLSSLTTLHIQNNQFSGTLDVLQDLPLKDLDIENNLFSGPVPPNLLNIPKFKKDGNPFNTSTAPTSAPSHAPFSGVPSGAPPGDRGASGNSSTGTSTQGSSPPSEKKTKKSTGKIVLIVFGVVLGLIFLLIIVILVIYCLSKLQERNSDEEKVPRREDIHTYDRTRMEIQGNYISSPPRNEIGNDKVLKVQAVPDHNVENPEEPIVDSMGVVILPPLPVDKVIVNPIIPPESETKIASPESSILKPLPNPPTSAVSYSVASLQQYTNSFSEENFIRDGKLGKVYRADMENGRQLMVLKLDNASSQLPVDNFFELVLSLSELRHPNIVELVGFCVQYDQRLLVYKSFSNTNRTLHDVLHGGDDTYGKLSWKARMQVAFGAAKALQYLHECEPQVVHQNFESANILLDDELAVRVCYCGLAPIVSGVSVSQLSGRIRSLWNEAPEIADSGEYSDRSDVYSFGVVMLELLSGREPYDSSRPRAEQHLVRWVTSQLHDIDNLSKIVDPSIAGKFPIKSLSRFADIVSRCIQSAPEFRPQMSEVVQDLARILNELDQGRNESPHPS